MIYKDEAYIDFSPESSLNCFYKTPNLVVLQTLSKAYGMAGLRIGLASGPAEIIEVLNTIKPPYNISSASLIAATETLRNCGGLNVQCLEIISERKKLESELQSIQYIKRIFPSDANFILVQVDEARACYRFLKDNGIIVRDRSSEVHCEGCLRITIGTPEENRRLLQAMKKFELMKS
jgi:histidinol-phosphate aminotransferase